MAEEFPKQYQDQVYLDRINKIETEYQQEVAKNNSNTSLTESEIASLNQLAEKTRNEKIKKAEKSARLRGVERVKQQKNLEVNKENKTEDLSTSSEISGLFGVGSNDGDESNNPFADLDSDTGLLGRDQRDDQGKIWHKSKRRNNKKSKNRHKETVKQATTEKQKEPATDQKIEAATEEETSSQKSSKDVGNSQTVQQEQKAQVQAKQPQKAASALQQTIEAASEPTQNVKTEPQSQDFQLTNPVVDSKTQQKEVINAQPEKETEKHAQINSGETNQTLKVESQLEAKETISEAAQKSEQTIEKSDVSSQEQQTGSALERKDLSSEVGDLNSQQSEQCEYVDESVSSESSEAKDSTAAADESKAEETKEPDVTADNQLEKETQIENKSESSEELKKTDDPPLPSHKSQSESETAEKSEETRTADIKVTNASDENSNTGNDQQTEQESGELSKKEVKESQNESPKTGGLPKRPKSSATGSLSRKPTGQTASLTGGLPKKPKSATNTATGSLPKRDSSIGKSDNASSFTPNRRRAPGATIISMSTARERAQSNAPFGSTNQARPYNQASEYQRKLYNAASYYQTTQTQVGSPSPSNRLDTGQSELGSQYSSGLNVQDYDANDEEINEDNPSRLRSKNKRSSKNKKKKKKSASKHKDKKRKNKRKANIPEQNTEETALAESKAEAIMRRLKGSDEFSAATVNLDQETQDKIAEIRNSDDMSNFEKHQSIKKEKERAFTFMHFERMRKKRMKNPEPGWYEALERIKAYRENYDGYYDDTPTDDEDEVRRKGPTFSANTTQVLTFAAIVVLGIVMVLFAMR